MKSYICLTVLALLIAVAGCAPRLAQTPLGAEEKRWEDYIKKSYPAWKAPQTVPPVIGDNTEAPALEAAPKTGALEALPVENDNITLVEEVIEKDSKGEVISDAVTTIDIKEKNRVYVVQKNDTLWKISQKFYSDGTQWKKIQAANDDILKGTSKVMPGMTLRIP